MRRAAPLAGVIAALALTVVIFAQEEGPAAAAPQREAESVRLLPTRHPDLPASTPQYRLVPELASGSASKPVTTETAAQRFARGAQLVAAGNYTAGLPLVAPNGLAKTPLAGYAQLYSAAALVGMARLEEADAVLTALAADRRPGYLGQAVRTRLADVALARNDAPRAVEALRDAIRGPLVDPEVVLLQLAMAADRAGDETLALDTYRKIYFDYPLSAQASDAQTAIVRLQTPERVPADLFVREKERSEALFAARRWAQARAAFEPLARTAEGSDKARIAIRIAACDYYLNRFRPARDALTPYLDDPLNQAEARFYYLSATRGLGDQATYVRLARKLVEDFPRSPWAEETLTNLASHFIGADDDAAADLVLRQLVGSFPKSKYAERAGWLIGWRAYRAGAFREAADTFERAAETFPRADYRPAWLYWSGRARQRLDETEVAARRYAILIADYQNSYYGRLGVKTLATMPDAVLPDRLDPPARVAATTAPIPTDELIRDLVTLGLYDDALKEVQFAQRAWGDSPQLQATTAFIRHNQGIGLKAEERFAAIRGAITTMRRAYPQFLTAGGEHLPDEVLRIIFPLDYWPLITKYGALHDLDPYLLAALIAQESTFTAEIRSSANAYGLMQLIPATARRYARKVGIRNFTTSALTNPETNIRLGTEYFKELMTRFGGAHYALASYNAGEGRVQRWINERGPLPADEFVDDIPFAETQNYVKRILGTADDYRRLYGPGRLDPNARLGVPVSVVAPAAAATRKPAASAPAGTSKPASASAKKAPVKKTPAPAKKTTPTTTTKKASATTTGSTR